MRNQGKWRWLLKAEAVTGNDVTGCGKSSAGGEKTRLDESSEMSEMRRARRAVVMAASSCHCPLAKQVMVKALSIIAVGGKDYNLDRVFFDIFSPVLPLLLKVLFTTAGRFEQTFEEILVWTCFGCRLWAFRCGLLAHFSGIIALPHPIVNGGI
uniref:Uncharacterized protein n=1 Tax=Micrurus corallinus TaxID=54390 RepID=A0A2D4F2F1_MICCO